MIFQKMALIFNLDFFRSVERLPDVYVLVSGPRELD